MVYNFLSLKIERRIPLWLFIIISSLLFTSLGFFLGAYIHPLLLLILTSIPVYPIYLSQFKVKWYWKAIAYVFIWATTISVVIIFLTMMRPSLAVRAVLEGVPYQEEMFSWIATGVGAEVDPSTFIPQHLINATVFTTLSLATGGFLALLFGAYQMNYMNFYVGILLSRVTNPTYNNLIMVALLSWPIYAIIRVVGFIFIGLSMTIPMASRIWDVRVDRRPLIKFLFVGMILVGVDIVLKVVLAPLYQNLLHKLVST